MHRRPTKQPTITDQKRIQKPTLKTLSKLHRKATPNTPKPTGYDPYGYNYQAHLFKGSYYNVYSGGEGYLPYKGDAETYLAENPGPAHRRY